MATGIAVKPLVVAQAPGKSHQPDRPALWSGGGAGKRFAALLDVPDALAFVDTVNLIDCFPGRKGKGDEFPLSEARAAAERVDVDGRPFLVLLGLRVARAFDVPPVPLFLTALRGVPAIVVPHTSGINRWYNEPANAERVRRALKAMMESSLIHA